MYVRRQSPTSLAGDREKGWELSFPRRELSRLRPCGASSWDRRGVDERQGDADWRYLFVLLHCDRSCNSSDLPLCVSFFNHPQNLKQTCLSDPV